MKISGSAALVSCTIGAALVFRLLTSSPLTVTGPNLPPFGDSSSGKIYSDGPYQVEIFAVESANEVSKRMRKQQQARQGDPLSATPPPKPLLLAVPQAAGSFPVVQLQHGFSLKNLFYRQLMSHVASHGFIVVAPQMYPLTAGANTTDEIAGAAAVLDWLPAGLATALPAQSQASPDTSKVALVGHSRGGKVAFGVALGMAKTAVKLSALAGLDPVDGMADNVSTPPPILQHSPHAFNLPIPTLVLGSGLGSVRKNIFFPPCVPAKVGHAEFFIDSGPPAYHFVAKEYGHMDFLDDNCSGVFGMMTYQLCKNGPSREPMRRFTGGVLVAFLKSALLQQGGDLREALTNASSVPVAIDPPESYEVEKQQPAQEAFLTLGTPLDVLA